MLSRVMLRAVEVAVELWLGLSWSPQAQLLNDATQRSVLAQEVRRPPLPRHLLYRFPPPP